MTKDVTKVSYSNKFNKQLKKAPAKIKEAFLRRRELFLQDSKHPQINNHALSGELKGYRGINVTGDWRAIFSEYIDSGGKKTIFFEMLGTHSQLYK